jgi:hypothetical protein
MAYLIICLFFGLAVVLWFLISAVVPFLGLLAAVLMRPETTEVRRQCPRCGRIVKLHDQVCMRCGMDMDFPETAIVPESMAAGRR